MIILIPLVLSSLKYPLLPELYANRGRPKAVNEEYLARLKELVSHSPREYGYGFERWTAQWLSKHLVKELEIKVSACHINRLLKEMGLSTRPKFNTTEKYFSNQENSSIIICEKSIGALV